jgi:hypothetical protein
MKNMKALVYLILILACSTIYCNAQIAEEFFESVDKRGCTPFGGVCDSSSECCGYNDPNSGHCVICAPRGYLFTYGRARCGCDRTGSVAVDSVTNAILSDVCNGQDASGTRCATRVAPPGHRHYRGKQ